MKRKDIYIQSPLPSPIHLSSETEEHAVIHVQFLPSHIQLSGERQRNTPDIVLKVK